MKAKELFNIETDFIVTSLEEESKYVPEIDRDYLFNKYITESILAGFLYNKRVLVRGFHGTGKTTHIEQVAARLNWPCIRVNLDGHITKSELVGKDTIIIKDGKQITDFKDGILPWSIRNGICLIFDEYDAGRADIMFILQRILEQDGKFTLLDKNEVIVPHKNFRIFATANTVGFGDKYGIYHGAQPINQAQIDRWNIIVNLSYLSHDAELSMIVKKTKIDNDLADKMIKLANLTRQGFIAGDIPVAMSPRTIINWAENIKIFHNIMYSFILSFLNRFDNEDQQIISEYYQRCFGEEIIFLC